MRIYGIDDINYLYQTYNNNINIIFIYISEAHPIDEWPISIKYKIEQHKSIKDKILAAMNFKNEFDIKFRIYVDSLNKKNFEYVYSCWPERSFIIHQNKIKFISFANVNDRMKWKDEIINYLNY